MQNGECGMMNLDVWYKSVFPVFALLCVLNLGVQISVWGSGAARSLARLLTTPLSFDIIIITWNGNYGTENRD